jgi:hypothetical protein
VYRYLGYQLNIHFRELNVAVLTHIAEEDLIWFFLGIPVFTFYWDLKKKVNFRLSRLDPFPPVWLVGFAQIRSKIFCEWVITVIIAVDVTRLTCCKCLFKQGRFWLDVWYTYSVCCTGSVKRRLQHVTTGYVILIVKSWLVPIHGVYPNV